MFIYDFPLSPKARTYLKFESIFQRIEKYSSLENEEQTLAFIRGIVDYLDLTDGSGAIKIELVKDIEKIAANLRLVEKDPDADLEHIQKLRDSLKEAHCQLDKFTRQSTVLKDDPIIECIKPRFMTPCGINCFDTPLFVYWSSLDPEEKRVYVQKWLYELNPLRTPVFTILYIWRLCADFQTRVAHNGFMQETSDSCDLIEIRYPKKIKGYPVVSGFQSSINIRFLPYEKKAPVGDIEFELAYIRSGSF